MKQDPQGGALIVLPAYNEQEALGGVIAEIRRDAPGLEILVVDDGSTDGTSRRAIGAGVRVAKMPFNVGVGGALRTGLVIGHREHASAVVQCDADGQHPPSYIPALIAALADADIVIGARFAGAGTYRARGPRRWAMTILARSLSRVHHTKLTDVTSGFRAFGPRAIEVLSSEMPPDYLGDTVEALVIAREHGLNVIQIPVEMRERQGGVASHNPFRASLHLMRAVLMLVLSLARLAATHGGRR